MRLSPLLLVVLLSACAGQAVRPSATPESEVRASHDLADIAPALAESTKRTLLVLDIDDTLLTSDGFFGSDKWYEWQKTLPAGDPGKVPCLFDVISLNYETGGQRADLTLRRIEDAKTGFVRPTTAVSPIPGRNMTPPQCLNAFPERLIARRIL